MPPKLENAFPDALASKIITLCINADSYQRGILAKQPIFMNAFGKACNDHARTTNQAWGWLDVII